MYFTQNSGNRSDNFQFLNDVILSKKILDMMKFFEDCNSNNLPFNSNSPNNNSNLKYFNFTNPTLPNYINIQSFITKKSNTQINSHIDLFSNINKEKYKLIYLGKIFQSFFDLNKNNKEIFDNFSKKCMNEPTTIKFEDEENESIKIKNNLKKFEFFKLNVLKVNDLYFQIIICCVFFLYLTQIICKNITYQFLISIFNKYKIDLLNNGTNIKNILELNTEILLGIFYSILENLKNLYEKNKKILKITGALKNNDETHKKNNLKYENLILNECFSENSNKFKEDCENSDYENYDIKINQTTENFRENYTDPIFNLVSDKCEEIIKSLNLDKLIFFVSFLTERRKKNLKNMLINTENKKQILINFIIRPIDEVYNLFNETITIIQYLSDYIRLNKFEDSLLSELTDDYRIFIETRDIFFLYLNKKSKKNLVYDNLTDRIYVNHKQNFLGNSIYFKMQEKKIEEKLCDITCFSLKNYYNDDTENRNKENLKFYNNIKELELKSMNPKILSNEKNNLHKTKLNILKNTKIFENSEKNNLDNFQNFLIKKSFIGKNKKSEIYPKSFSNDNKERNFYLSTNKNKNNRTDVLAGTNPFVKNIKIKNNFFSLNKSKETNKVNENISFENNNYKNHFIKKDSGNIDDNIYNTSEQGIFSLTSNFNNKSQPSNIHQTNTNHNNNNLINSNIYDKKIDNEYKLIPKNLFKKTHNFYFKKNLFKKSIKKKSLLLTEEHSELYEEDISDILQTKKMTIINKPFSSKEFIRKKSNDNLLIKSNSNNINNNLFSDSNINQKNIKFRTSEHFFKNSKNTKNLNSLLNEKENIDNFSSNFTPRKEMKNTSNSFRPINIIKNNEEISNFRLLSPPDYVINSKFMNSKKNINLIKTPNSNFSKTQNLNFEKTQDNFYKTQVFDKKQIKSINPTNIRYASVNYKKNLVKEEFKNDILFPSQIFSDIEEKKKPNKIVRNLFFLFF